MLQIQVNCQIMTIKQIFDKIRMKILAVVLLLAIVHTQRLVQVVSVSRHGARYHYYSYGNSSQTKPLQQQLTATGMRQLQSLGKTIRKQYVDKLGFLSPNYNPNQIQVYSTPVNRTVSSIISLLHGLYPPGTGPRMAFVEKQWHLPPYTNKTDSAEQNFALPNGHQTVKVKINQKVAISDCPRYDEYLAINLAKIDDQYKQMMVYYKPFMNKLAGIYNLSASQTSNFETFLEIYDVINVDKHLGRPIPSELTDEDFLNLRHMANWYYYVAMGGNSTAMADSGKISKIFSVFQTRQRIPDTYALKWTFMSGHDTDILALHLALNISSYTCTEELFRKGSTSALNCEQGGNDFASNLIFELYTDDNIFFNVKVRSNGKYVKLCNKNSEVCDYYTFKNMIKKYVVSNIEEVCGKSLNVPLQKGHKQLPDFLIFQE